MHIGVMIIILRRRDVKKKKGFSYLSKELNFGVIKMFFIIKTLTILIV
jgi:hypothetical protein